VAVIKLQSLRDKRYELSIKLTNHTSATQFFALHMMDRNRYTAKLTDENGNEFVLSSATGIGGNMKSNWIPQPCEAGGSYTATLKFSPTYDTSRSSKELGQYLSLTTDLMVLKKDREGSPLLQDERFFKSTAQLNFQIPDISLQ